jgi:hypothetical protein
MEKKKYARPAVRKVRLNVKASVLGYCQMSPDAGPDFACQMGSTCPTPPPP